jgi:hypothetical protein
MSPGQRFKMGATDGEEKADSDEKPQHRVRITKPFYLGVYEVTQQELERLMGRNPSSFSAHGSGKEKVSGQDTGRFPVENVSWYDAIEFCNNLSESENRLPYYRTTNVGRNDDGSIKTADVAASAGSGYRLPTEGEWGIRLPDGDDDAVSFRDVTQWERGEQLRHGALTAC